MRIALVFSLALLFSPVAASAAPPTLFDHAATTKSLSTANAGVEQVG